MHAYILCQGQNRRHELIDHKQVLRSSANYQDAQLGVGSQPQQAHT
jgi:hypothetical protein